MPFAVSMVLPSDLPILSSIQWAALLSNPLIQTLYPEGPTPALEAFTQASYRKAIQYPSVRLIKAVDVVSEEIVAFAKWIVYSGEKEKLITLDEEEWVSGTVPKDQGWGSEEAPKKPEGVDERALRRWNGVITKTRRETMRNRQHSCQSTSGCSLECYFASIAPALWVLDIIHTHPSQQGRGAGAQLLKWGTDLADKSAIQCYVESSPAGCPLFRNHDFEEIATMEIDLNQNQKVYRYRHTVMIRPPNTPPLVPPKDVLQKSEWDFGFLDSSSPGSYNVIQGIARKASLIEIKRSPRLDRSTSSKKSDSFSSMTGRFPDPPSEQNTNGRNSANGL